MSQVDDVSMTRAEGPRVPLERLRPRRRVPFWNTKVEPTLDDGRDT